MVIMTNENSIVPIPSWCTKLSYNYRGNVILMNDDLTKVVEVVINQDGSIALI